jgi:hypothetical protein
MKNMSFLFGGLITAVLAKWFLEGPAEFLVFVAGLAAITWIAYVLIMVFIEGHNLTSSARANWSLSEKMINYPLVVVGLFLDLIFNKIGGTVLLLEPPKWGEWLLTARLKRLRRTNGGEGPPILRKYRLVMAKIICEWLLNPFDAGHC